MLTCAKFRLETKVNQVLRVSSLGALFRVDATPHSTVDDATTDRDAFSLLQNCLLMVLSDKKDINYASLHINYIFGIHSWFSPYTLFMIQPHIWCSKLLIAFRQADPPSPSSPLPAHHLSAALPSPTLVWHRWGCPTHHSTACYLVPSSYHYRIAWCCHLDLVFRLGVGLASIHHRKLWPLCYTSYSHWGSSWRRASPSLSPAQRTFQRIFASTTVYMSSIFVSTTKDVSAPPLACRTRIRWQMKNQFCFKSLNMRFFWK